MGVQSRSNRFSLRDPTRLCNTRQPNYDLQLTPTHPGTTKRLRGRWEDMTQSSRWTVAEKVLGVLAALLTLATGFLAYKTATITQAKEQALTVADDRSTNLSALQSQYDTLKSENARLRTQLSLGGLTANPQPP